MEESALKILETTTHRTLHAQGLTRSSTQASLVLTDLLSRYLFLLASTCAKYANHSGRINLTPYDAFSALDELGVSIDELEAYGTKEGKEMQRYNVYDDKMITDLSSLQEKLLEGLRQDRDDAFPLYYAPLDELPELPDIESESESESEEMQPPQDVTGSPMQNWQPIRRKDRVGEPPLPISPPPSPARKRARTSNWNPPDHVPDFLPPFPVENNEQPSEAPPMQPPPSRIDKPPTAAGAAAAALQPMASSSTSADYFVRVPYAASSLSAVPEWHLPPSAPPSSSQLQKRNNTTIPTPQPHQALLQAYHHILTHPPPPNAAANTHPARHNVAMSLIALTQHSSRWDSADTMYSAVAPTPPRGPQVGPTFAMPAKQVPVDPKAPKKEDKLPGMLPRSVINVERISPLVSQQSSRIPHLAKYVLPPPVLGRTNMLQHPPVLLRQDKKLVYGTGVPAPWNTNDASSTPAQNANKESSTNKLQKDKVEKPALPDAVMYATWEYQPKNYKIPLEVRKPRVPVGGVTLKVKSNKLGQS